MKASSLIRRARLQAGISQAELATRLGTKQPVVARWESGRRSPSFATVLRALRACGFELDMTLHPYDAGEDALIRERLAMTPRERLEANEALLALERLARAAAKKPPLGPHDL